MFGWFRSKPKPPPPLADLREWNDDWKAGDTAEVVVGDWFEAVKPWERLKVGDRYIVTGFAEGPGRGECARYYFLYLEGLSAGYSTQCFRKVRPVADEKPEVVSRILNAKPGVDRVREDT